MMLFFQNHSPLQISLQKLWVEDPYGHHSSDLQASYRSSLHPFDHKQKYKYYSLGIYFISEKKLIFKKLY